MDTLCKMREDAAVSAVSRRHFRYRFHLTALVIAAMTAVPIVAARPSAASASGTTLNSGQWIVPGQSLGSPDVCRALNSCTPGFRLIMQTDGNLVQYYTGANEPGVVARAIWSSGTAGHSVQGVWMQTDGNLVLYATNGAVLWASWTQGHPGAYLSNQDDGNLVVYQGGTAWWNSNTSRGRDTESYGGGTCWRGAPVTCKNKWTRGAVYFRAVDQFSSAESTWLAPARAAVSAWNGAPGPQWYSFTPRTANDDTFIYLKAAHDGDPNTGLNGSFYAVTWQCTPGFCTPDAGQAGIYVWTNVFFSHEQIDNGNPGGGPLPQASIQFVFLHESGHGMLLAHNPLDLNSVMYNAANSNLVVPSSTDIGNLSGCDAGGMGLACIYGSGH